MELTEELTSAATRLWPEPSLYSTLSRAFEPPSTGKITVKAINHYRGEVLKVYACRASKGNEGLR